MDLKAQLAEDLKTALRSGDKLRTSVIRLLTALIKNREIEKRGPLTDTEAIQAVSASCKQRQEAIEQYRQGGRQDLVDKETAELAILQSYLPTALSPDELQTLVREAIRESQVASPREMGKVMALLMPKVTGLEFLRRLRADPSTRALSVLVLSNSSREQDMEEITQLGVAGYYVKADLSLQELGERVAELLGS